MDSKDMKTEMVLLTGATARDPFYKLVPTRPRLMAGAEAIDRVKKAIADNCDGQKLKDKVILKANEVLKEPQVKWQKGDLLYVSKDALRRLLSLGMAWLLEKNEPRYVDRAKLELAAICGFQDWHPPHFLDTAQFTLAAAIGYDWFYDQLDDDERRACVKAILEKGLKPGLAQLNDPKQLWPNRTMNWNIICNAGLMIGALAVYEADRELTSQVFVRCLNSVPIGFRCYSPDGSMDEGPGYWTYATEYAVYLLSSLYTAVGHEFGLGDLPGMQNAGRFRMHAEGAAATPEKEVLLFNFSDCDETHGGSATTERARSDITRW